MKRLKKYAYLLALLPVLLFSIGIFLIGAENITEYIWIENSYIFMFIIAFLGGISLFSGVPYPLILITLALWGSNILYLSIATTIGVMLWDSTSYYIWKKAKNAFTWKTKNILDKILSIYDLYPKYIMLFFFVYGICSPFPNDMITLSSGIKKYNFWKTMIPLTLWNFIFCLLISYFAEYFAKYF